MSKTTTALPLISIIIPTYNRERYIRDAIDSIIAQSYSNWEIIIVDDCSSDNTSVIIEEYQKYYPVTYLLTEKPASGASLARNIGIQESHGEFIIFLDSDDLYYSDALMVLYKAHLEHPGCQVTQGFYTSVDVELNPIKTQGIDLIPHPSGQGYLLPYGEEVNWEKLMRGQVCASLTTCLIKREVFDTVGLLREDLRHWEDYEYIVRIYKNYQQGLIPIPAYIVKYRAQPESTSRSAENNQRMIHCYLSVLDNIFNDPELPQEIKSKWYSFAYSRVFRVLCRIQLKSGRNNEARTLAFKAIKHSSFSPKQWAFQLAPIVVQSFLSPQVYEKLASMNRIAKLQILSLLRSMKDKSKVSTSQLPTINPGQNA